MRSGIRVGLCTSYSRSWRIEKLTWSGGTERRLAETDYLGDAVSTCCNYGHLVLYAPSIGLTTVTNLLRLCSMAIMGAIVTVLHHHRRVKAVVYTDVLQTLLMFGGVLVVVVLCCIELGGVGEVWAIAERGGRIEFFKLMWFFLPGLWCMWILFFFSDMVAYAVYSTCDPLISGKIEKADQIIPFLVTDKLGHIPGVSGLFMAACMARYSGSHTRGS
ncbi:Sodium-coupled monocarboxylate transporter 1 [Chionoecetes opilio]|uniref:Sodium-coupled monocarboxylate transporter 1 n=1 Tax=Chionoecetes opilio TaxID=41210 RepID=A0A8J4Y5D2_CHIOP|nr:Sodium-coupled monocarboxylate transporter 1 [Chionoecetes opilio]